MCKSRTSEKDALLNLKLNTDFKSFNIGEIEILQSTIVLKNRYNINTSAANKLLYATLMPEHEVAKTRLHSALSVVRA